MNTLHHHIRAEWLKLTRRPLSIIVLIVFLVQMALFITVIFLVLALSDGTFTNGTTTIQLVPAAQQAQFRAQLQFPGILGEVLGQINGIGGICAVILAAGAMGSEFTWGTLRLQLARQPQRTRFLVAKCITILLVIMVGMGIALLVGSGLGLLYGTLLHQYGSVSVRDVALLPFAMLRSLSIMLPYLLFTIAMALLGRSTMAGIIGGILLIVIDAGTGTPALIASLDHPIMTFFYQLLMQPNVNALIVANRALYGLDPSVSMNLTPHALPAPWHATVVLAIYSGIFATYAYVLLTRRDIPSGS